MREWSLAPGDPLALGLAADFRLCEPDYANDHIWELEMGGDPPALALRTTYGLRARSMRIFPSFSLGDRMVSNPASFPFPPRLRQFFPNLLWLDFSPLAGINVSAEYWVPDSHTVAGRLTVTNRGGEPLALTMQLCGQLVPLDGQSLAPVTMQSVSVLAGRTGELAPVIFLTGGPLAGPGPYPSLALDLALASGSSRTLTWAQAALSDQEASFELARRTAARGSGWEAERVRIELVNAAQTIEVQSGDPDWDAAFALGQKTAFSLFFGPSQHLPYPSFVIARQPDQGYSLSGDGSDYPSPWSGQSPLEAYTLASLIPGAPELAAGLLRNFLTTQKEDGHVDCKPGLAGQRQRWLAAPILSELAWQTFQRTRDFDFLREVRPGLKAFLHCWFSKQHDRDQDGFPEWDHVLQTALEDNPAFTVWQAGGQGAEITAAESPALAAMLSNETRALARIAEALGLAAEQEQLEQDADRLRALAEQCWRSEAALYHYRDRDGHHSPAGKTLKKQYGPGHISLGKSFRQPIRLLVRITLASEATRRPEITLSGQDGDSPRSECLDRMAFQWGSGLAVATSQHLYTRLDEVEVAGVETRDLVSVQVMDFSSEDISLCLPLWAGSPHPRRAHTLSSRTLFAVDRFGRPFGFPTCPTTPSAAGPGKSESNMDAVRQAVHLTWNALIGEGLLRYGLREQAAQLTARLMAAVITNLKRQRAFYRAYHSETGAGLGERNALQGLAPLGLFLATLGVEIQSPKRVALSGQNPFPWPVTVKYRGLTVTRQANQTVVVFPSGETVTLDDPSDVTVSAD